MWYGILIFSHIPCEDASGFVEPHGDAERAPAHSDQARRDQEDEWSVQCENGLARVAEDVVTRSDTTTAAPKSRGKVARVKVSSDSDTLHIRTFFFFAKCVDVL